MSERTTAKLAELKKLAAEVGTNVFRRLVLANDVLGDVQWLDDSFAGELSAAETYLEQSFFPDLSGFKSLATMLCWIRTIPDEAVWKRYKYRLSAIEAEYDEMMERAAEASGGEQTTSRANTSWQKVAKEEQERARDAEVKVEGLRSSIDLRDKEIDRLKREVQELRAERDVLRGRISELERFMDLKTASVA